MVLNILGITGGVTGQASIFTIDTSDVGAGTLAITVDGPSKVDLSCNEVDEGYEVAYTPMVPGKYFVTVKYNGNNIKGSPFSVQVSGDNLNTSSRDIRTQREQSKRSSVTMETMSRTSYVRHQYSESRRGTIQGLNYKYSKIKFVFIFIQYLYNIKHETGTLMKLYTDYFRNNKHAH